LVQLWADIIALSNEAVAG